RWDVPLLKRFSMGVEAHEGVRFYSGFAVPDGSITRCCDSVGLGIRAAWRRIFLHLFRLGVQTPEIAASVVGVPNDVVGVDGNPPWARPRIGQGIFRDLHRLWIDTADLVGTEQVEERKPLRVHFDPVWQHSRACWLQRHVPGFRIELAYKTAALDGEPERSVLREDRRMRIARRRIGHLELAHLPGLGIELRNRPGRG